MTASIMGWMDGMMGMGWMSAAMGLFWLLLIVVLVLAIAALLKFLRKK